jgi:HK97 family phage major capsid protein
MARLEEIDERLEAIRSELLTLAEGDLEEEQAARFDALETEHGELETERAPLARRAAMLDRVRSTVRQAGDSSRATERGSGDVIVRTNLDPYEDLASVRNLMLAPNDLRARALTAIEQAPTHMTDDQRQRATELVEKAGKRKAALIARHILCTGSPEYHEAFESYVENPENAQRAALSLTSANGGFLVPFTLDPTIILTNAGSANPFRQISQIKTTATNNWNGVTSAGVNAAWLAEGTEDTDHTPTVGNIQITPQKASAWVFGSYEVLEDSDFASELPMLLADAKDRLEEAAFATGTGTGQPKGIITAATSTVTSAGVGAYAVADVYATQQAVPPRWRSRGSWVSNVAIINKTRQFDTAGGSSFWANLGAGQPERLLGAPIYESTTVVGTTTTGSKPLVYGDFSQYAIVDRIGMSVLYEPLVKGASQRPTGQAGWFAFWRVGADVLTANAFRVLTIG